MNSELHLITLIFSRYCFFGQFSHLVQSHEYSKFRSIDRRCETPPLFFGPLSILEYVKRFTKHKTYNSQYYLKLQYRSENVTCHLCNRRIGHLNFCVGNVLFSLRPKRETRENI